METAVDGRRAWSVLFACFCSGMLAEGVMYTAGIFNVIFLLVFKESKALTSWVTSLYMSSVALLSPAGSLLVSRCGWRVPNVLGGVCLGAGFFLSCWATNIYNLFVTFGIIAGLGQALTYTSSLVAINHYFKRYRTVACGIHSMATSMGTMVFAPLLSALLDKYDWRVTLSIVGGICLHICVCGMFLRPLPQTLKNVDDCEFELETAHHSSAMKLSDNSAPIERQETDEMCPDENETRSRDIEMKYDMRSRPNGVLRYGGFVLYCASMGLVGLGHPSVFVHLTDFSRAKGASQQETALCLSLIGFMGLLGRSLVGIAASERVMGTLLPLMGTLWVTGMTTVCFPILVNSTGGRVVFSLLFGLYGSCYNALLGPLTVQLVGLENLTWAIAVLLVTEGIAMLAGPPITGWLYDLTGSYEYSFYMAGTCLLGSVLFIMLIPVMQYSTLNKKGLKKTVR